MRSLLGLFVACGSALLTVPAACGGSISSPGAGPDASSGGSSSGVGSSTGSSSGTGSSGSSSGLGGSSSSGTGSGSSSGIGPDEGGVGGDASASGSSGGGSGSSSGGGSLLDASFDVTPPPTGQAGFAFVVNGAVLIPMSCPAYNWEFPAPAAFDQQDPTSPYAICTATTPPCPGITSALIINTGQVPLAYTAQPEWSGVCSSGGYPPGVQFGDMYELSGVLNPGDRVDIASGWLGGATAVLGASEPFSSMGHYASDEGMIPWPAGVAGSNGATTMYVAEINLANSCHMPCIEW